MKKILIILLSVIILIVVAALFLLKSDSKNPYERTTWGKFSATCEIEDIPKENFGKTSIQDCDYSVSKEEIPAFNEVDFPFNNIFDNSKSLPLMASAMIDIDNDGVDEVFVGGGYTQNDAIFKYVDGKFSDITAVVGLPNKPANTTTYGAISFDLDGNGFTDLLLTGDYGVLWLKNNGKSFTSINLNIPVNDVSVPASVTVGDINRDGHVDIFVSNYIKLNKMRGQTIFKDLNYGGSSLMMVNNGDDTFTDATAQLGLEYVHNTFMGVMVDIDNDGYLDLVVAYDTGEARTYRNNKGQSFTMVPNPTTGKYAYPMGIAVGDYNNDGFIDFFFSNTGTSVPTFLARGDLEEDDLFNSDWILLRNEGDFKFSDVAKETNIADFEFSWGAIFEDYNLDGLQDLVVAENYVDFPPHKLFKLPGRFLVQRENGTFASVEEQANAINRNYSITPLSSDFNQDGYPDMLYINLDGPVRALINKGGDANYLSIRFVENTKNLGARVVVTKEDDSILSDAYVIGEGLASDQTSTVTFGLGAEESVKSVSIYFVDGTSKTIENPGINIVHGI